MDITRRDVCRYFGAGLLATMGLLVSCGNESAQGGLSPSEAREELQGAIAGEETTLSQALSNGRTLWYEAELSKVAKDGYFSRFLIFENGQVTENNTNMGVTFGDLDGLSDDEIISLIDAASAKNHAEQIDKAVSNAKELIASADGNGDIYRHQMPRTSVAEQENIIQAYESIREYQVPQPVDYKLKITTDKTGNTTEKESIVYQSSSIKSMLDNGSLPLDFGKQITQETSIVITAGSTPLTVYSTQYAGGYTNTGNGKVLVAKTTKTGTAFVLDVPGTDGIEVD